MQSDENTKENQQMSQWLNDIVEEIARDYNMPVETVIENIKNAFEQAKD